MYIAALYMRLSREDGRGESLGIESQRLLLRAYAEKQGMEIYDEYVDDGYSGTNYERPAFERMKKDIEDGKINTVITKDMSRLGRNYIATGALTEEYFPRKKVRFIAINDGYDSALGEDDISPFRHVINEMYARDISRKIKSALRVKMEEGQYIGSFPPYGYKKSEDNKNQLEIDYPAGEIVREIFASYISGEPSAAIAEKLNKRGVPVPLDYRIIRGGGAGKGRLWTSSGICKILKNKVYLGHTEQGKSKKASFRSESPVGVPRDEWIVVKNTHDALVSEGDFLAVREKMTRGRSEK